MLRTVNRLDWDQLGRSSFVTTTWRDELGRPRGSDITQARSWFQRSMERLSGSERPGIWRIEWKERASGQRRGEWMPHIHIVYLNCPFIAGREVTRAWTQAVGSDEPVRTDIKEIVNARQCLYYVSKYMSKPTDEGTLVIEAYLNSVPTGRQWGMFRKNLIPFDNKHTISMEPGKVWDRIRELAADSWKGVPNDGKTGFTLFGPAVKEVKKLIEQAGLEMRVKVCNNRGTT